MTDSSTDDPSDAADEGGSFIGRLLSAGFWMFVGACVLSTVLVFASLGTMDGGVPPDLYVEYEDPVVNETNGTVELAVVGPDEEPVENVAVIVRGDTLNIDEPANFQTGQNSNTVRFTIQPDPHRGDVTPEWRGNQETGKLRVELIPPSDSNYADDRANAKVTIVRNGTGT